jgi:chromosome segregation ATPase
MKAELDDISTQLSTLLDIQGKVESLDAEVRAGVHSQRTIRDMVNDRKRYIESCNEARRQVQNAKKEFEAIDMEQGTKEHTLETKLQGLASQIEGIKNNTTLTPEEKQEAKAKINDTRRRTLQDIEAIGAKIQHKKERYARAVRSAENTLKTRIENLNDLESHLLHRVYRP